MVYKAILNPISLALIILICILLDHGVTQVYHSDFWGIVPIFCGIWLGLGFKSHPADPYTVGLVTLFGVKLPVVVNGIVLLAKHSPFVIDSINIEMTQVELEIRVSGILSQDSVAMSGLVTAGVEPHPKYLSEYIKIGKMKGAQQRVEDIIMLTLPSLCTGLGWRTIQIMSQSNENSLVSLVKKVLENRTENPKLPVITPWLKIALRPPEEILKKAQAKEIERLEREYELADELNWIEQGQKLWLSYQLDPSMPVDKKPTLQDCINEMKSLKIVSQGRATMVISSANGIVLNELHINN